MAAGARRLQRILAIWHPQINSFGCSNLTVALRRHQDSFVAAVLAGARIVILVSLVLRTHVCSTFDVLPKCVDRLGVVSWARGVLRSLLFTVPQISSLLGSNLEIDTFARAQGIVRGVGTRSWSFTHRCLVL